MHARSFYAKKCEALVEYREMVVVFLEKLFFLEI